MATYEKAVRFLMVDMVRELQIEGQKVLTKSEAIGWFRKKYPAIDQKTVECHLTRLSVNAPSRLHYHAVPREDDVLFKIDANHFRLYNASKDPAPIWTESQLKGVRGRRRTIRTSYDSQIEDVLNNLEALHDQFYADSIFTGPSLHFHQKVMNWKGGELDEARLEYIYATLASWGMHRMGKRGSKMLGFETFKNSVLTLEHEIERAKSIDYRNLSEDEWGLIRKIFCGIRIMKSGTSIVGNSKVMAHLIPNMIPPIDRAYTISYLRESIKNGHEYEWPLARKIVEKFFIPIATNKSFLKYSNEWMSRQDEFPWDTSPFKIIDNLTIAAVSRERVG